MLHAGRVWAFYYIRWGRSCTQADSRPPGPHPVAQNDSEQWDLSSKSKPNNNHFNNNHFNKNQFNNNHFNTDLLTNTESEFDEYDLVSRSLFGWKFVDLAALLSRQMLKKFNIELNHCWVRLLFKLILVSFKMLSWQDGVLVNWWLDWLWKVQCCVGFLVNTFWSIGNVELLSLKWLATT